jgi:hypothetical protein
MVLAEDNPLAISIIFDPPYFSLDTTFKGTVQRKLRGVESYINQKDFVSHWTTDILFEILKGTGSLNREKHVSAAERPSMWLTQFNGVLAANNW